MKHKLYYMYANFLNYFVGNQLLGNERATLSRVVTLVLLVLYCIVLQYLFNLLFTVKSLLFGDVNFILINTRCKHIYIFITFLN